jgi:hypothetical protein
VNGRERELRKGELMYVWSNAHVKWGEGGGLSEVCGGEYAPRL